MPAPEVTVAASRLRSRGAFAEVRAFEAGMPEIAGPRPIPQDDVEVCCLGQISLVITCIMWAEFYACLAVQQFAEK
jgi:hypothetical protein